MTLNTYKFGLLSECIAIVFLLCKGYTILHWRYKTYGGEIDIIAKKGKMLVMVEVKSRRYHFSSIQDVISPKQIRRNKRAADIFLSKKPRFHHYSVRFDLIIIKKPCILSHFKSFC